MFCTYKQMNFWGESDFTVNTDPSVFNAPFLASANVINKFQSNSYAEIKHFNSIKVVTWLTAAN